MDSMYTINSPGLALWTYCAGYVSLCRFAQCSCLSVLTVALEVFDFPSFSQEAVWGVANRMARSWVPATIVPRTAGNFGHAVREFQAGVHFQQYECSAPPLWFPVENSNDMSESISAATYG